MTRKLERSSIAKVALDIIDREGLPGLSMRRLGAELGVEGMALYRHFPEKKSILDEVVKLILADLATPADSAWHERLSVAACSLRERLLLHPNAMPLVAARWSYIPVMQRLNTSAIEDMTSQRIAPADASTIVRAVMSLVLGYSWLDVGGYVGELPDTGGLTREPAAPLVPCADDPAQESDRRDFERALAFLLEGARSALAQPDDKPVPITSNASTLML